MGLRKSPVAGGPERASEDRLARILPRTGPDTGSAAASILSLFPRLPPAPEEPKVAPGPAWPAEVEQILAALDRTAEVDAFDGGLQVVQTTGRPHPLRDEWQSVSRTRALFAGKAWFMARANRGSPPEEAFCRGDQRAVFRPDLRLGRMRPAADADHDLRFSGAGVFLLDFVHHRRDGEAEVVSRDGAIVTLRFRRPAAKAEWVLVVDRDRRVVLEQRVYIDGRLELKLVWSDWTETGGLPFAGLHEEYDGDGAIAVRTRTTATARPAAEVSEEIGRLVEGTGDGLFLAAVDRAVPDAKRAAGGGTATFADRFALVLDHAGRQQWDEALAAWVAAKALAAGKPGAEILEAALLAVARRGEALLELLTRLAAGVAGRPWAVRPGLADTIRGFGERVLGGHEMLGLTRALRAALPEAGEDFAFAARLYDRRIAGLLASLDRPEEALAIRRALVDAAPDDPETWAELVDAYSGLRRPGDALATAEAALAREAKWTDDEARPLHQRRADHRWQERDLPGFLAAVDLWIARKPRDEEVFERRLAGLLFSGRIDDVDRAILAEIATGPGDSPAPADLARFAAAVDVALGSAWNLWTNRLDERFVKPLGDAALRLARRSDAVGHQANRILGNWRFRQQDEYWRIIAGLREDLFSAEALREMSHDRLQRTAGLFDLGRSGCTDEEFARLSTAILARIGAAEEPAERAQFGDLLLSFLDRRGDAKGAADLLRQRLAAEPDTTRNAVAVRLVERLLRVEWTRSVEDEVLSLLPVLLPKVAPEEVDPQAESRQWAGIARLVADGLLSARVEAALGPPAEREKLPRAELAARRRAARQAARADLADRFFARAVGGPERLAPWLAIEALCLRAEAGGDAAPLEGIARELLLSPPSIPAPELAPVFLERATLVLEYLATRRDAAPALVERVLALARERAEAADGETREDRRYGLFRLLLALDRPDDLVALLRSFAGEGRVESFYRTALAYLLAERGSLAEAAEELEAVARAGELGAAGFSTLAGWHLALGEDERRSRALDRMLGETDERQLGRRIRQELGRVREPGPDGVPESLDPEIFCVERILLGKATRPADYLNGIRQLYEATKDLRALAALADGIVGHSPEAIYPYLTKAWTILKVVHEEATLDEVAARVRARAERASTPTDRRGLLYLAALVFRRAAEVRNRPEVHAEQALPALREAFPEEWLPGEPRLLARFLASLGAIPDAALAAEHLRQLAAVHAIAGEATWDGLAIAAEHAAALDAYGRHDEAIDMLTAALDAVRAASGGRLPPATFVHAETLLRWLTAMGRFAAGEEWLLRERGRQPGEEERAYLTLRLLSLHSHALRDRGRISLGAGEALFTAAFDLSEQAALALPAAHVHEVLERLCQLTRVAAAERIAGAPDRLAAFARERSRPALDRAPDREQFLWLAMASAVHDGGRPEVALSLLVEKLEQDPEWYPRAGRDGWARFADRIAHWRAEQEPEGDFADRLAKIVVSKLVEELGTGENHGHGIYHDDSECFWPERAAEFAAAARRVVELRPDSPSVVLRVASYLWVGLSLRSEAVDVLTRLDGRGMLPDHGRLTLALWLMEIARHAEAVPHLKTLLAGNPDRLDVRSPLVVCFHELGRDGEGTALADETEHLLREQKRWDFRAIVTLAEACFTCGYHDRAARWFEEAIRLAERRRMPPGSLSPWYGKLGRSLSALGRVEEAVDAATAAVVSWGRDVIGRQRALDDLTRTLGGLPDLDGFVAGFAKKAAETGLDAPILRKRIGVVYLGRGAYAKAAEALRAARELAPMDREVHDLLVRCADLSGDGEAALAALAESLSHAPSDLSLMAALAARLENAGRSGDAERARTNYVEAEPLSAAGHSRLAAEREQARRFEEALVQRRLAVRLREFDPEVWFELVATLRAAGRPDEAKEILTRMMARPWSSEAGDVRSRIAAALR
jgi:tetratricopeptide (TPR) repeat protein